MRALHIQKVAIRTFRNLAEVDLSASPEMTIVAGDNGQGKTNFLEAIYLAATTKSFRGASTTDLIAHGAETAHVRTDVAEEDDTWVQALGIRRGARVPLLDSKKPPSLAHYATRTPVVLFHPDSVQLSTGPGAERRRLLDRVALFLDASHLASVADCTRATRVRQRLIETHGPSAPSLADWEAILVRHAIAVQRARTRAAQKLQSAITEHFADLLPKELGFDLSYAVSSPDDEFPYREILEKHRAADFHRKRPSIGPLRDDLVLRFGGRPMRGFASQGQHRAAVLALKLGELVTIAEMRGAMPVVLLDDFSSELDPTRTRTLLALLKAVAAQVILTTASPDIARLVEKHYAGSAALYDMAAGVLGPR